MKKTMSEAFGAASAVAILFASCSTVKQEPGLRGDIAQAISAEREHITECYVRHEASAAGRSIDLRVDFRVMSDGSVSNAKVGQRTALNPALESCVLGVFEKIRFKPVSDGGTVDVTYPLRFSTSRE